jgi:hypothetical protein
MKRILGSLAVLALLLVCANPSDAQPRPRPSRPGTNGRPPSKVPAPRPPQQRDNAVKPKPPAPGVKPVTPKDKNTKDGTVVAVAGNGGNGGKGGQGGNGGNATAINGNNNTVINGNVIIVNGSDKSKGSKKRQKGKLLDKFGGLLSGGQGGGGQGGGDSGGAAPGEGSAAPSQGNDSGPGPVSGSNGSAPSGDGAADQGKDSSDGEAEKAVPQTKRFLKVKNDTGTRVTVVLQYRAKQGGSWVWLPAAPGASAKAVSFEVPAGKELYLAVGGERIAASRVRLWAFSSETEWDDYRNRDLWLVPETDSSGAHVYMAPEVGTFTFVIPRQKDA